MLLCSERHCVDDVDPCHVMMAHLLPPGDLYCTWGFASFGCHVTNLLLLEKLGSCYSHQGCIHFFGLTFLIKKKLYRCRYC